MADGLGVIGFHTKTMIFLFNNGNGTVRAFSPRTEKRLKYGNGTFRDLFSLFFGTRKTFSFC